MLTAKEIEEFTMTQEEIDAACEKAVEVVVMPKVRPVERAYNDR